MLLILPFRPLLSEQESTKTAQKSIRKPDARVLFRPDAESRFMV
jgi:hypothetical protein